MISSAYAAIPIGSAGEWAEYHTPEGRPYYFNIRTRETRWDRPVGISVAGMSSERPRAAQHVTDTVWVRVVSTQDREFFYNVDTCTSQWEKPEDVLFEEMAAAELDMEERANAGDEAAVAALEALVPRVVSDADSGSSEEEESEEEVSADQAAVHAQQFVDLLRQLHVEPFAKWDKVLPRMVHDPRFQLLPMAERKKLFAAHVRKRPDQLARERKERVDSLKEKFLAFCEKHVGKTLESFESGKQIRGFEMKPDTTVAQLVEAYPAKSAVVDLVQIAPKVAEEALVEALEPIRVGQVWRREQQLLENKAAYLRAEEQFKQLLKEREDIVTPKNEWKGWLVSQLAKDERFGKDVLSAQRRRELFAERQAEMLGRRMIG